MMTTNKPYNNHSTIGTLEELQVEIQRVKNSITEQEQDLSDRIKRIPLETVKAGIGYVIPFAINNKLAVKGWSILQDGLGLLLGIGNKKQEKEHLSSSVKQLGFFSILKGIYTYWKK